MIKTIITSQSLNNSEVLSVFKLTELSHSSLKHFIYLNKAAEGESLDR